MRLITRPNLDGVTCAVLVTSMESVEQVVFAERKDIEDGTTTVEPGDAIANLPFHNSAALWFDHHDAADVDYGKNTDVKGRRGVAPSAARLVYEYYNSSRLEKFKDLVEENDRINSAYLTLEDVLNPADLVLLSYTIDPFMGLDSFHGYANSIIAAFRLGSSITQIMDMPEVRGRVNRYFMDADDFKLELAAATKIDGNVLITDFRNVDLMPLGNRFITFAIFPQKNVQVRIYLNERKSRINVRLGKNIFNRTCPVHLGRLAAEFGGGGLDGAAGCTLNPESADVIISEIINRVKAK